MNIVSKQFLFLSFVGVLFCCGNSDESTKNIGQREEIKKDTTPTISTGRKQLPFDAVNNSPYVRIDQNTKIEVQTVNKSIDTASKFLSKYSTACKDWNLGKNEITKIIKSSTQIDGHEFHYYYTVLPCHYSGQVIINSRIASYEINAGAFVFIFFKDTSVCLGYKRNDYEKYFILGPGIE